MNSNIFKKNKKILLVGGIIILLAIMVAAFLLIRGESARSGNEDAFNMTSKDLLITSCSLDNRSGVSQGETLEITFNQLVSTDVAKHIDISPSIDGEWQGYDNRLVFVPDSRWENGTYYKVKIDSSSSIYSMNKAIKRDRCFSFETQDSALRIPAGATFEVEQRQYYFGSDDEIILDANYDDTEGNVDTVASVKVWEFASPSSFADSFLPLFELPQWATISRNRFIAETSGLNYLGKKDIPLVDGKINYNALPHGKYLFRLVVGGAACDVAVTVDNTDVYYCYDGSNIYAWAHDSGEPIVGSKLRIGKNVAIFDENGCAKIAYTYSDDDLTDSSENRVMEIVGKEDTHVMFLTDDNLKKPKYSGNLILGNKNMVSGDSLSYGGRIQKSKYMRNNTNNATITLKSSANIISESQIKVNELGNFRGVLEKLILPNGNYQLILSVDDQIIESQGFTMDSGVEEYGHLLVTRNSEAVYNGNEISFRVKAVTKNGTPIRGIDIKSTDGTSIGPTNSDGETMFYLRVIDNVEMPIITKNITFSCAVGGMGTITAMESFTMVNRGVEGQENGTAVKYSVSNGELVKKVQPTTELPITTEAMVDPDGEQKSTVISFVAVEDNFVIAKDLDENATFSVTYSQGEYSVSTPRTTDTGQIDINVANKYEIDADTALEFYADAIGMGAPLMTAELYAGELPSALNGTAIYNEGANVSMATAPLATTVGKDGYFSFPKNELSGKYYVRIWAKDLNGNTVSRYVPVMVKNGAKILSDVQKFYPENQEIILDFSVLGKGLSYQVTLNGTTVDQGQVSENLSTSLGTLAYGDYSGSIDVWNDGTIVAQTEFEFTVYKQEPPFMRVKEGKAKDALVSYRVPVKDKDYFKKIMSINLLPGDQLLQVMGRNMFYNALGENSDFLSTYINENLSYCQNGDGSFSRLPDGHGDLLLSTLVAADTNAIFDREALKAYYYEKMAKSTDTEMIALCYWGLSLLSEAPIEYMTYHLTDNSFTDKAKLYLAEAFYASGYKDNALNIYNSVAHSLSNQGEEAFFPNPDEQDSIFQALFMLDLSMKLKTQEVSGLLTYLMDAKMETQTNRYLMSLCLLDYVNMDDISLDNGSDNAKTTVLSIVSKNVKTQKDIKGNFNINQDNIDVAPSGSTVELSMNWGNYYDKNDLYMVYFTPKESLSFWYQKGLTLDHGHVMYLTMKNHASIYFEANEVGENLVGDVYLIDLTLGKVVGKVAVDELVVSE